MVIRIYSKIAFSSFVLLFFTALICTILGGMLLPWERIWPWDGYVLFAGQVAHILTIIVGIISIIFFLIEKNKIMLTIAIFLWLIALITLLMTWDAFFVYGIPPFEQNHEEKWVWSEEREVYRGCSYKENAKTLPNVKA